MKGTYLPGNEMLCINIEKIFVTAAAALDAVFIMFEDMNE
jgi:hypothetical protein